MNLTLEQYIKWIDKWKLDATEVVNYYLNKAKKENPKYNCFVRFHEDYVKNNIESFKSRQLKSAPIWIKDIIFTKDLISSCGSKMLENYVSPYSATCFENLEKNWWMMIWKTNMDEFAMWSSTENSYFWPTINNHWENLVPWWSSWWSTVAVSADFCIAALWTDTWWSIRQPSALCGIVWMKPTYWMVSRYWVQSMASSLDQVWTITKTVADAQILLQAIAWFDPKDSQSDKRADNFKINNNAEKKIKIAIPKEVLWEWLDEKIKERFLETVEKLRKKDFEIDEISIPLLSYSIPIYYILMPAEVSTNLARFDWIKFWLQEGTMNFDNIQKYYEKIRSEWFGDETKRRILLWTFVLSSANYEWYYLKAQKAREKLKSDFDKLFTKYDIILTPTSPEPAWKIWERTNDPLKMYLADIYTVPANIAWLPAMSVPIWNIEKDNQSLPVWIQIMANKREENKIFELGKIIEEIGN